uniref:Uncharacterized protein n=1 Tax=Heliothis virescens TaxID=7102 RepID=A0A2A4K2J7_HELVI
MVADDQRARAACALTADRPSKLTPLLTVFCNSTRAFPVPPGGGGGQGPTQHAGIAGWPDATMEHCGGHSGTQRGLSAEHSLGQARGAAGHSAGTQPRAQAATSVCAQGTGTVAGLARAQRGHRAAHAGALAGALAAGVFIRTHTRR